MQKESRFFFSFSSESKLTKGSKLLNCCRIYKKVALKFGNFIFSFYLCTRFQDRSTLGEMVEWSITVVLKTTVPRGTGGSNPSLSATKRAIRKGCSFSFSRLYSKKLHFFSFLYAFFSALLNMYIKINLYLCSRFLRVLFLWGEDEYGVRQVSPPLDENLNQYGFLGALQVRGKPLGII